MKLDDRNRDLLTTIFGQKINRFVACGLHWPELVSSGFFKSFTKLKEIEFSSAELGVLSREFLSHFNNVECLRIKYCNMVNIDCDAFFDLNNLKHLEFKLNAFKQKQDWNEIFKCFKPLENLVELKIRKCFIESLSNQAFSCFPKLEKLDIGCNLIVYKNITHTFTQKGFKKKFSLPLRCKVNLIIDDDVEPEYDS
jgi:hypothetical protein